jgi:hypothetical protein
MPGRTNVISITYRQEKMDSHLPPPLTVSCHHCLSGTHSSLKKEGRNLSGPGERSWCKWALLSLCTCSERNRKLATNTHIAQSNHQTWTTIDSPAQFGNIT